MSRLDVDVLLPTLQPIFAGSVQVWRSHQVNADGEDLQQADLAAGGLDLEVYSSDGTLVGSWEVTISSSVFDALQTASGTITWRADGDGFNLIYKTLAAQTPAVGEMYTFIFRATPASGSPWYFGFRQPTFSKKFAG